VTGALDMETAQRVLGGRNVTLALDTESVQRVLREAGA